MSMKPVAVRKDEHGRITHFLTDKDTIITLAEADNLAHNRELDTLSEIHADGSWVISEEDGVQPMEGYNLVDLPEF